MNPDMEEFKRKMTLVLAAALFEKIPEASCCPLSTLLAADYGVNSFMDYLENTKK